MRSGAKEDLKVPDMEAGILEGAMLFSFLLPPPSFVWHLSVSEQHCATVAHSIVYGPMSTDWSLTPIAGLVTKASCGCTEILFC